MPLIEQAGQGGMGRRAFLRLLALGLVGLLPGSALAARAGKNKKLVYRLSTHGHRTCTACKAHAANRFYKAQEVADGDRAHPGCNCAIVTHKLKRRLAKRYFKRGALSFDLRSGGTT